MDNSLRSDRSMPDHNAASRGPGCARAPANARLSWPVPGGRDASCVREGEKPQKGPVWRGFLRLSLCAFGVLPVPLGFGASGRFLVYMKMYFRMKSSARTYIMGLIFFALPVTALTAT